MLEHPTNLCDRRAKGLLCSMYIRVGVVWIFVLASVMFLYFLLGSRKQLDID